MRVSCSLSDKSFCHLLHIPGVSHILYLLPGLLQPTITLEFEDVDIVLGLNHNLPYLRFAAFQ